MIIALFALAAALVIGGSAAVVQGFPFVRLESGLAMVIAGATAASAGAILFGLGVVALGLKRVEKGLKARREAEAGPVPVPPVPALGSVFPEPPRPGRPILPGLTGLAAGGAAAIAADRRPEPTFEDGLFVPAKPNPVEPDPAEPDPAEPDPRQPELPIPAPEPRAVGAGFEASAVPQREPYRVDPAPPAPDDGVAPEDDLFAGPLPPEPAEAEAPALRPALDPVPEPAREAAREAVHTSVQAPVQAPAPEPAAPEASAPEATEEASPAKPPREVVGKYASGGNTYVMYGDGSIEAETPRGRFSFASLDELKAFIDAGGEGTARGEA